MQSGVCGRTNRARVDGSRVFVRSCGPPGVSVTIKEAGLKDHGELRLFHIACHRRDGTVLQLDLAHAIHGEFGDDQITLRIGGDRIDCFQTDVGADRGDDATGEIHPLDEIPERLNDVQNNFINADA